MERQTNGLIISKVIESQTTTNIALIGGYVHHFDEWRNSISEGKLESNSRRAQRFARDVNAIHKLIKKIIPNFLERYTTK
jgi:hypothetical protein